MARLPFPESGTRRADNAAGKPIPDRTYTVYTDPAGTALANIAADNNGTPGTTITGSTVTTDSYGYLPIWWGPDSVDRLYLTDGVVTPWPVDAIPADRIDALTTRVATLETGGIGGAVSSVAGKTGTVTLVAADVAGVETPAGSQAKADAVAQSDAAALANHAAATTTVHGIPDTSVLETVTGAQAKATAAQAAAVAASDPAGSAAAAVNVHAALTTNVHGIDDTSNLETVAGSTAKANAAAAASIPLTQKGAALGVATLGVDGKLAGTQIPPISLVNFLGVSADQTAMLALTGQPGDWTTRDDLGTTWVITGGDPTRLDNWTELSYPTAPVTSVAGRTGSVTLTAADVGLGNVTNLAAADLPISTDTQAALDAKAPLNSPAFTGTPTGITKAHVGLSNVLNLAPPDLGISTDTQAALDLKAPIASPTFTGTVTGISKAMVGLGSVDNTADNAKPVSAATQAALDLKAPLADPTFTGTVAGVTKAMVGLGSVDNTTDAGKPVSTAQAAALALKVAKSELVYNVKDFGTLGDGSTDDTAELQAAIDLAATAVGGITGGIVFLPRGAYIISAPLVIPSRVSLVGVGATTSTIRTSTSNIDLIQVVGTSLTHKSQVYLRDFGLIGPGQTSGSTGCGIVIDQVTGGAALERLYIASMGSHGIKQTNSYDLSYRDILATGNGGNGYFGQTNVNNTVWDRCMFLSNSLAGFHVDSGTSGLISGCDLENNTGSGIELLYTNNYVVLAAEIENNGSGGTRAGIYLHWHSGSGDKAVMTSIIGCDITGTGVAQYGIRVDGANLTHIQGNQLLNNTVAHISTTANAARTVVGVNSYVGSPSSGNLSDSSTSTAILDYDPTALCVRTNTIEFQPASTPAVAAAGQLWYSSGLGRFRHRDAGAVRDICSGVTGSVVLTSATVPAGGTLDTSATVSSALPAQKVALACPTTLPAGLVAMAFVPVANTVTVRLANVTGSAITGVSGTFNVQLIV